MAAYLELSTGFRVGDEYRSTVEKFQNHVRTIASGVQLSREEFEARIVELDLVIDLEWSSSDVSFVEGLGLFLVNHHVLVHVVPQLL